MAKELGIIDFNLPIDTKKVKKPTIVVEDEPLLSINAYTYKLSDLARLDEKSNLGLKLLKPRNPNAKRGSQFEILTINKTNLIVRREWVTKSWLLVIIPEKLIYKIFNEQTGECIYDPGKTFMDELSDRNFDFETGKLSNETGEVLTEEQKLYIGTSPNIVTLNRFFQNINHSSLVQDINNSELLYGKAMFKYVKAEWIGNNYVYRYKFCGLPFRINTLLERQIACLYYKAPYVLNKTGNYPINQKISLDQMKISLKLLREFPHNVNAITSLEHKARTEWPDDTPITDINKLRRIFLNIQVEENGWWGNAKVQLSNAIYQYVYGCDKFDEFRKYLLENEYVNLEKRHYFDIMKKAKALNNGKLKNKYPTHWLTYERKIDRLFYKHEAFIKSKRKFEYPEHIEALEHITAIENKDYDYQVMLPRTYGEILEEGEKMHHCVGGYADGIYNGDKLVLFVRKKSKPDKPLGTIDFIWTDKTNIKTYSINQAKGPSNTTLPMEVISYLAKYIQLKKLVGISEYGVKRIIEDGRLAAWEEEQIRLKEEAKKAKEAE